MSTFCNYGKIRSQHFRSRVSVALQDMSLDYFSNSRNSLKKGGKSSEKTYPWHSLVQASMLRAFALEREAEEPGMAPWVQVDVWPL